MKILYAIQGTGNGHLSRGRDIVPVLRNFAEVDILISGTQAGIALPYPVKFQMKGLGFIFGKRGGVDLWETFVMNNIIGIIREVKKIPVENYDLVINDFEPGLRVGLLFQKETLHCTEPSMCCFIKKCSFTEAQG